MSHDTIKSNFLFPNRLLSRFPNGCVWASLTTSFRKHSVCNQSCNLTCHFRLFCHLPAWLFLSTPWRLFPDFPHFKFSLFFFKSVGLNSPLPAAIDANRSDLSHLPSSGLGHLLRHPSLLLTNCLILSSSSASSA